MILPLVALALGLVFLVWSADIFVDSAAKVAKHFGMSPLLIGMIVIGFGTSAPEMVVSAMAALNGNPAIALGNAYGSNITNIALILGITAIFRPIIVHSQILKKELPILVLVTLISIGLLYDLELSRLDAIVLLLTFSVIMFWAIKSGKGKKIDQLAVDVEHEFSEKINIKKSFAKLIFGLLLLIASSRVFVWGAVEIAQALGMSDMVIGLTIVAIGTSLPELASSIIAARKGESDMAIGNIIGSNMFNTLGVVGIAGAISPLSFGSEVITRDMSVMTLLTLSLFVLCISLNKKPPRISRIEGGILIVTYVGYTLTLL